MFKNKKVIFLIILLLVFGGIFLYFKKQKNNVLQNDVSQNNVKKTEEVKVGLLQNLEDINFVLDFTNEKGFFTENEIKFVPVILASDSDRIMQSGETDVRVGDLSGTISTYLNGGEPRWIATPFRRFGSVAISRYPKESVNEIKKVAIIKAGTSSSIINKVALDNLGVNTDNIEFIAAPSDASREAMLDKGEADFTILMSEKFLDENNKRDKYTIYNDDELFKGSAFYRAITTTELKIKEKPETIKKFVTSVYEGISYLKNNKEEAISYLQNKKGFTQEKAEDFYSKFVSSLGDVEYTPKLEQIKDLIVVVQKNLNPSDPNRNMENFVFQDFAKNL